MELRIYPCH